jgi:hypothetical protein
MKYIFVSSKVESSISALRKSGKSGNTLARKVAGIIDSLASGKVQRHIHTMDSYTKYGEKRLKNCLKYDLGCGYRLITLKRGNTVFIPFLGSHDECQRWLEKYSPSKAFHAGKGRVIHIKEQKQPPRENFTSKEHTDLDEEYDDILQNVTENDLRSVFKGLVKGAENQ